MKNTTKNANNIAKIGAVEYASAIKEAVDELSAVIRKMERTGLALSAQISFGRILNVGIRAAGAVRRGRPPKCPIAAAGADGDEASVDVEVI